MSHALLYHTQILNHGPMQKTIEYKSHGQGHKKQKGTMLLLIYTHHC